MRSTKSRSRGKNRSSNNRSPSNNINRVFDSSGPEGKVRGTPQQIIDKYTQLARDAQLSNDRVNAENFQQHAEHYTRLLSEAQRDAEEKRLQVEQANRERQQQQQQKQRDRDDRGDRNERDDRKGRDDRNERDDRGEREDRGERDDRKSRGPRDERARSRDDNASAPADPGAAPQPEVVDLGSDGNDSGLVETPETKPRARRAPRPRKPKAASTEAPAESGGSSDGDAAEVAK